jgi:hypothetical protein
MLENMGLGVTTILGPYFAVFMIGLLVTLQERSLNHGPSPHFDGDFGDFVSQIPSSRLKDFKV